MKYWRGYLVAGILAVCTWALKEFAMKHAALVDMFYPYVSRMIQSFLAQWSAGADFCLWQALLVTLVALGLATAVLMLIFKWNPVQWFGWVLAAVSLVSLLNTGIYGLNRYAGPIAQDIRLLETDYTVKELTTAAEFFRDEANELAKQVNRDSAGHVVLPEFSQLAQQAGEGFQTLTKERFMSVFAGSVQPVKQLGWSKHYASKGVGGMLVPLTGEAAVNPLAPSVYLPFGICEQMARRMSIAVDKDAHFAAFMACNENSDVNFRYSGYLMAYYYCEQTLEALKQSAGEPAADLVKGKLSAEVMGDLEAYRAFFGGKIQDTRTADLLVSWHIQQYVLPLEQEEVVRFDPLDETQVDLSGLVNAPTLPAEG